MDTLLLRAEAAIQRTLLHLGAVDTERLARESARAVLGSFQDSTPAIEGVKTYSIFYGADEIWKQFIAAELKFDN